MKILVIMAGFFPGEKYGGPPVSVDNFCSLMKDDECFIITTNHDKDEMIAYDGIPVKTWVDRGNCRVMYLQDQDYTKKSFEAMISDIKPHVLYLQGLFQRCILPCLQIAKKYGTNVILAPRGELCAGAFHKKYKKLPYIAFLKCMGLLRNICFQSTSREETEAIQKYLDADISNIFFLTNIPSISNKDFVREIKQKGLGRFIFLSRIHPKKNLISAIGFFKNITGKAVFDIYGPIEDQAYWEECQQAITKLPDGIKAHYCGLVSHEKVHEIFSKYDAFVFPTFSENYGHVIAEALSVGIPVIISDQTPWRDLELSGCGWDIPLGQEKNYADALQTVIDMDQHNFHAMSMKAKAYFNRKTRIDDIREMYHQTFMDISGRRNE